MATPHAWHQFDDKYEVRQVTEEGEDNQWEVREMGKEGPGTVLTDEEYNQFREAGPNPKGLD
jgi:hypothetical protein